MTKISDKMPLLCILFFFCLIAPLSAQSSGSKADAKPSDEKTIVIGEGTTGGQTSIAAKSTSVSSVWVLVRIVLVLALVCAGIYGVVYLLKKSTGTRAGDDPYLKTVASLYLSPNKSIQVITIGEKALVIGITDQNINLLSEVSDRELVDAMNLQADKKNPVPPGSFQSVLSNFIPGFGKKTSSSPESGPTSRAEARDETDDLPGVGLLRAQRERLQRNANVRPDDENPEGGAR